MVMADHSGQKIRKLTCGGDDVRVSTLYQLATIHDSCQNSGLPPAQTDALQECLPYPERPRITIESTSCRIRTGRTSIDVWAILGSLKTGIV